MGITTNVSSDNKEVTISVKGRFDINVYEEFSVAYKGVTPPGESCVVDLAETEHLDSTGLGMLLLMRERLGRSKIKTAIANCPPEIARTLESVGLRELINNE